jgi:hypothetical protein
MRHSFSVLLLNILLHVSAFQNAIIRESSMVRCSIFLCISIMTVQHKSLPSINIFGSGYNACTTLFKLLYRPDDDPVEGRNIVAKAEYIYTW